MYGAEWLHYSFAPWSVVHQPPPAEFGVQLWILGVEASTK